MDSFEMTKIAGSVLAAMLLIFGAKTIIDMHVGHGGEKQGYSLPGSEPAAKVEKADAAAKDATAAPAAGGGDEVLTLLAKASADNGKAVFGKCKSCHLVEKGKTSTVGPNLWGIVNRAKGSYEGFKYSEGILAKGGNWTFADLSAFIRNPKGYVPGTKMVFNGIASPADEADVIAYLATLADTPVALPK